MEVKCLEEESSSFKLTQSQIGEYHGHNLGSRSMEEKFSFHLFSY